MEKNLRGDSKREKLDNLTERLSEGRITRRGFIKGGLALGFSFGFLSGIQSDVFAAQANEYETIPVPEECMKQVREEGSKLNIYDWAGWWPEEIYDGFAEEFDISITRDNFANIDEMVTKFKLHPKAKYDFVLPDTRSFQQLRKLDVLRQLNHDWISNVRKYIPEWFKDIWYDPGYKYQVPTDLYFTGYSLNSKYVDMDVPAYPHWDFLFEEAKKYAGKFTMLNTMFNDIGNALQYLGFSCNSTKEDELRMAEEVLLHQKPWVMAYNSWPKRLFLEEEIVLAHNWIGEAWFYHKDLPATKAGLPPEGTLMGVDSVVIPKGGPHPAAAHLFMNYLFRPKINALLIETIGYAPNHKKTAELLPEEMKKWPGVQPSREFLDRCEFIRPEAYTGKGLELRSKIWEKLKR